MRPRPPARSAFGNSRCVYVFDVTLHLWGLLQPLPPFQERESQEPEATSVLVPASLPGSRMLRREAPPASPLGFARCRATNSAALAALGVRKHRGKKREVS